MADEAIRRIARVSGRVQGVGFRFSAQDAAQRIGVAGTVRNLVDGTVEADVEGSRDQVEQMLDWLRQGPSSASVESVDVHDEEPRGASGFSIAG